MSREAEGYRDELEQVLAFFGDKRVLSLSDVAKYTGKSRDWCKKYFDVGRNNVISSVQFARALVKM